MAHLRPAKDQIGRLFFDVQFNNGCDQRTVTLLLRESFRDFSGHVKRFDRMLADVGFNNTKPQPCIAFVLGSIAPVTHDSYMNLQLARTLEDVVILPYSGSQHARALSAYLDRETARREELRRQEQLELERALQAQREAQRKAEADMLAAEQERQRELDRLAAQRAQERELSRKLVEIRRQQRVGQPPIAESSKPAIRSTPPSDLQTTDSKKPAPPDGLLKKMLRALFG